MMKPKLSIIIPCYNNGKLLSEMIDCILRQRFADWELIIVDDVSTDNTQDIVRKYEQKDTRVKLIIRQREPQGSATCRNIGFDNAKGEYVIHFDADDLISDTCLEKRVAFMDANPDIDYASFPAKSFFDSNKLPVYFDKRKIYGIEKTGVDLLTSFLKADYAFSTWNNIYRRKSIENFTWDEKVKIYTDFSFIVPCMLTGLKHKFSGLQEIDYFYRQLSDSQNMCSDFVSQEKCDSTIYLFSKTLDALMICSNYKIRKKEFMQFIILHFERLIVDGNKKKIDDYLNFCKKYYGFLFLTLLFICKLTIPVKNLVFRKLLLYIQTSVLFFRKQSALSFAYTIKN